MIQLILNFLFFWGCGFFTGLFIALPFIGVKNLLDVASASAGEIRGA